MTTELDLSSEENTAMVYRTSVTDVAGTREVAEEIFGRLGCGSDESRTDIYEDEVLYWSEGGNRLSIWVHYAGKSYRFTNGDALYNDDEKEIKLNATESEVIPALEKMGVTIPEGAVFR